jgi:cell division protein FtsL
MRRGVTYVAAYMHGNLALKEEERNQSAYKSERVKAKKPMIPMGEKLLYLCVIVTCMMIAGAVLYQSAQLYSVNTRIQDVEREIMNLEKENQMLKLEGEKLREPQRLYDKGRELGFIAPEEHNVISVSSDKYVVNSKEQKKTAYLD